MSDWEDAPAPSSAAGGWEDAPPAKPLATTAERGKALLAGADSGVASLLGLPVDTVENIVNLAVAGYGTAKGALGGGPGPSPLKGSFGGSEHIMSIMNKLGIGTDNPRPDDPASRMLYTGGKIAGSSILPMKGAAKPASAVPEVASLNLGTAATSATGGAVASEALGPEWTGVGAMAPASARQMLDAAKTATAARVAPNVKAFEEAGTTPSVAQATESTFLQGIENIIAKFPGGQGVYRAFAEKQQADMGKEARTGVSAEAAGRAIQKGITGDDGFMARTKAEWTKLDDALGAKVPGDTVFVPANTVTALDRLTKPTAGAEKTTGALANPKLAEMKKNLDADLAANDGAIPFEALRALRTKVGSMLDESLITGIPNGELKAVYKALSGDLGAAATSAGAAKEFKRQADYYSARVERIEKVLEPLLGKGKQAEDIFKSFMPTDPDQAGKVRATLRSLKPDERKIVTDAVVNRMGRAKASAQDEMGENFSSETFLTNWNKLSEGAKAQIFPDGPTRASVDSLAKTSANIREGSKIFSNPSGSAEKGAAIGVYGSLLTGAATGNVPLVAGAAGAIGGAYIGAKMLTKPELVAWLAKTPKVAKENMPAHLVRLATIYNRSDDATKAELDRFMSTIQQQ